MLAWAQNPLPKGEGINREVFMIPQVQKTDDHAGEKDRAMEVAEAARESDWAKPSFVAGIFMGNFKPGLIHPYTDHSP